MNSSVQSSASPAYAYPQSDDSPVPSEPLISRAKNDWLSKGSRLQGRSGSVYSERDAPNILAVIKRSFRRRCCVILPPALICLFLVFRSFIMPIQETVRLQDSLRERLAENHGFFGINERVGFANIDQLHSVPRWLIPGSGVSKDGTQTENLSSRRLIIIGDIHGCIDELKALLQKTQYSREADHIIAVGDIISRGPDSAAVVDLLKDNQALCVRGNHEDRVLLAHRDVNAPSHQKVGEDGSAKTIKKGAAADLALAESLAEHHIKYLAGCPVILDLGVIPTMGQTVVVHAGLVPAVPLAKQDPMSAMTMRSIDLRNHVPSKNAAPKVPVRKDQDKWARSLIVPWADLWNAYQGMREEQKRSSVIYGHDSKRGVRLEDWTWGLDGGCVKGGELVALVISEEGNSVKKEVVRVTCGNYLANDHKKRSEDTGN